MFPAGILALALTVCAPGDRPIVAEVFYDATGDDTGREFVELFNPADTPCSLAGLRLEAGDGAGPGRWTLRWTATPADSIAARGRFVVGGGLVDPPPQAVATLDLQNGPDAVRLVWPDGAVEVVGYGTQQFAEYACGDPAPDVASGLALARMPDDAQLGSNALDFRAAPPSPGRANRPDRDAALIAGALVLEPEQPEPEAGALLRGRVVNRGAQPLAAGAVALGGATRGPFGERALFALPLAAALAAGDTAGFEIATGPLPEGRQTLTVHAALAGDEAPGNDADSLRLRAGPGPLEITEIQFHPAGGEGEWVEVRNRGAGALDLAAFTLGDRGGAAGTPAEGAGALPPESLAVFAQNREALLARFTALDSSRVWRVAPWASLNNTNDETGIADAVVLRERDGTRCARLDYSASGVPAGVPIELRDGFWQPSRAAAGTPLEPPLAVAPLARRFDLVPRRLRAGAASARAEWSLPWPRGRVTIEVFDLAGRRVARPVTEFASFARGGSEWRAGDLPPGVYVVALRARDEAGKEALVETLALRVEGAAP